jgi:hypothetical protein
MRIAAEEPLELSPEPSLRPRELDVGKALALRVTLLIKALLLALFPSTSLSTPLLRLLLPLIFGCPSSDGAGDKERGNAGEARVALGIKWLIAIITDLRVRNTIYDYPKENQTLEP